MHPLLKLFQRTIRIVDRHGFHHDWVPSIDPFREMMYCDCCFQDDISISFLGLIVLLLIIFLFIVLFDSIMSRLLLLVCIIRRPNSPQDLILPPLMGGSCPRSRNGIHPIEFPQYRWMKIQDGNFLALASSFPFRI